ncbi:MAG: DUF6526 family protein [Acidobacteriota bacterium]|nr:DUF6526 family protein [Acidobacteriota bacterium]
MPAPQNYKNHVRWDPVYHFFCAPVLLLNVVATLWWYYRHHAQHTRIGLWLVLVSIALFLLAAKARSFPLKAQDRVIRVEERMRLAALVTASELVELESLTLRQYVGLRFASNSELPELARRAVREKLTEKQIKQSIISWRADNDRV